MTRATLWLLLGSVACVAIIVYLHTLELDVLRRRVDDLDELELQRRLKAAKTRTATRNRAPTAPTEQT